MKKVNQDIRSYLDLCRLKVSFFSALSAAVGFFVSASGAGEKMVIPVFGVFLLACGSSALNQYQERNIDALMERTKVRPLPAGDIMPRQALYYSLALLCSGFIMIAAAGVLPAFVLSMLAVLWYNGLYTPLKRKTAFAVIPGALVGAIPPAIGWLLGGGGLRDPRLMAICFFFFIWQVPHFWLLLLSHGKEYEAAGLPSLSGIFTRTQLARLIRHWIFATVVSSMLIFLYGLVSTVFLTILLFTLSGWFVWQGIRLPGLDESDEIVSYGLFRKINCYMGSVIILISFDQAAGYRMLYSLAMIVQ